MQTKEIRDVTDIIDIDYLQQIQDSLGRLTGITTALLDPAGVPVSRPTNLHAFCAMMQGSPSGVAMCMQANSQLIEINKSTGGTAVLTCPNSGLRTAAVPIFLGEQYLGSWLIGQLRTDDLDLQLIEQTAQKAGLDRETAKENISMLPVITKEKFDDILDFLSVITRALTDMVEVNHALNQRNDELVSLADRLDDSLRTFKDFIDLSDVGVYLVDYETGRLMMYNDPYKTLFNKTTEELEDSCCFQHMGHDDFCPFCPKDKLLDEHGNPGITYKWENYNQPADQWLGITSRSLRWMDGRIAIMTTFVDITGRKREEERIAYLAYHDQRLDVPNAVKLFEDLQACPAESTFMICFDIQGLRKINDVYGRDAGDNLLRDITAWVKAIQGHNLTLYRIDGDDFAVLLRDCTQAQAAALCREIYSRFDKAWMVDMGHVCQKMYAGAHIGLIPVDIVVGPDMVFDDLITAIERVLSTARKEGALVLFDREKNDQFNNHIRFEMSLKDCVLNNMQGFSLHYQPIVDSRSGVWMGVEALCRWTCPGLGNVPPDVFITEAEQLGLIDIIGDWVFEESLRQTKEWGLDKVPNFVLDVNLSPIQLNDRDLVSRLSQLLEKYSFPPEKLSLEITESAEIHFDDKTMSILERLRQIGVSLSLDDFGTGYATFANLKNLPVAILKTDRSFVNGIEEDAFLQHTVRIMVEFAHAAGLLVVAEGVETDEQRRILLFSGVDMIQGYYFSRPLPADVLAGQLDKFVF